MKSNKFLVLLAALLMTATISSGANVPAGLEAPGIYNPMNRQQMLNIEKERVISQPINNDDDKINEDFDMGQKDYFKDGVIYNPQFHVSEIIYEGNTKIKDATLNRLAEGVLGEDIYFEDLVKFAHRITKYYQ